MASPTRDEASALNREVSLIGRHVSMDETRVRRGRGQAVLTSTEVVEIPV